MRFDCGETHEEKALRLENWHRWFAWYPVRVGSHDCRWLEAVERKGTFRGWIGDPYWEWEYRALDHKS
jgi:hypothetical protein